MSITAELRRRKVFRTAGAYLVGAWIVLQVADTLFPALHMPPWTVTIVAVAAILGFPIALLLGWMFDITPGGIERTAASGEPIRFPMRAAAVGSVIVAVGIAGFIIFQRRAVASRVDSNTVAVLPFRVSGDASITMREGMVDLMSAKLTGEGGPRAIDSRTTLSAWRKEVDDEREDMPTADAVQLARSLGAGQFLQGELVGTPGNLTLHARLYSSIDGREITKADDAAAPDSLLRIVDRVVAKLLSQQAGQGHRTEALLSESLPAVQAYLDGMHRYRQGDHYAAADRFNAALAQDSTFALAGLGLALARSWSGFGPDYVRGRTVAWTHRDRLPQPDREYVMAWLGPDFPAPSPDRVHLAAWQDIIARAPDRIEAWHAYGDLLYHRGAIMGIEDAEEKAMEAWNNVLRRDSLFVPALDHQVSVYASRRDTTRLREVARMLYDRAQPKRKYVSMDAWPAALALGDEQWLAGLRASMDSLPSAVAFNAHSEIIRAGLPQDDVEKLIQVALANAQNPGQKSQQSLTGSIALVNIGKPSAALELLRGFGEIAGSSAHAQMLAAFATDYEIDTAAVNAVAATVAQDTSVQALCVYATWMMTRGDFGPARRAIPILHKAAAAKTSMGANALACSKTFEVGIKINEKAPDARAALTELDSLLARSPVPANFREFLARVSGQYHAALGDYAGAYAAVLRTQRDVAYALAPLVLDRARYAARAGMRDKAIAAYTRYLEMRPDPEPGRAAENVRAARNELAALMRDN